MDKKKDEIIKLLQLDIRKLFKFCDIEFSKLQEIRLRVNMPIMILYDSMEYFISCRGEMTKERSRQDYMGQRKDKKYKLYFFYKYKSVP